MQAKMQRLQWDDLKVVLAAARARSARAAGRAMLVDQSTVLRRLKAVEATLNARLFERINGVLSATPAGRVVIDAAERMETEALRIGDRVAGRNDAVAGTVRITAVATVVNHFLVPALASLRLRHPQVSLEFVADSRDLNINRREADIALRFARPTTEAGMLCQKVAVVEYGAFHAKGKRPSRLPWLTYENGTGHLPQARWLAEAASLDEHAPLRFNDGESIVHAVRRGHGKSLLPGFLRRHYPELRLMPEHGVAVSRELWLLVHPEIRKFARVDAVIEWILSISEAISSGNRRRPPPPRRPGNRTTQDQKPRSLRSG